MTPLHLSRFFPLYEAPSEFGRGLPLPAFKPTSGPGGTFDYDALPIAVANEARAAADQIRTHGASAARSFVEVGRTLTRIKGQLGHGQFTEWVRCEFGLNPRTAQNYMSVSAWLDEAKYEAVSHLKQRTLYALSSPSTPSAVREAVLREIGEGTSLADSDVEARIAAVKPARTPADPAAAITIQAHAVDPEADASDEVGNSDASAGVSRLDQAGESREQTLFERMAAELSQSTRLDGLEMLVRMDSDTFVRHLRAAIEPFRDEQQNVHVTPRSYGSDRGHTSK